MERLKKISAQNYPAKLWVIFSILISTVLAGCNKDLYDAYPQSIYNFKVVDYYTGQPVPNAKAILRHTYEHGGNCTEDMVIGHTDANGLFQYQCNVETIFSYQYYSWYEIYFISGHCPLAFPPNTVGAEFTNVEQRHTTTDVTIHLFQSSTVHLTTKRISANPMNMGSSFCGFSVSSWDNNYANGAFHHYFLNDTINQIHDTCYCVQSEVVENINTYVLYDCETNQSGVLTPHSINFSQDTLHTGYNDTVNFNIQY